MNFLGLIRKEAVLSVLLVLTENSVFSEPYGNALDIFERIAEVNISEDALRHE